MKNKYKSSIYNTYNDYDVDYKDYGQYIDISDDYYKEYYNNYNWDKTKPSETEDERLAREKAEKRDAKIDQILG